MLKYILFLWLSVCFITPCEAGFSLGELISASEKATDDSPTSPPDPVSLEPNWWNYYEVNGDALRDRIEASDLAFNRLEEQAPAENKEEINGYIQRILLNLDALPTAKQQAVPAFSPTVHRNSYTFDQLLELVSRKILVDGQVNEESKEQKQLQDRTKKVRQHIDTLYVTYMALHNPNVQKELAGLEIISLRSALAITEEAIRVSETRTKEYTAELESLKAEITHAMASLKVTEIDPESLEREITKAQADLKKAQDTALDSEMNAIGTIGDSVLERSKGYLLAQQSVLDAAKEALAKANLIFSEAKRDLLLLKSKQLMEGVRNLSESVYQWQEQLDDLETDASDWEAKTEQENDRALQPLTAIEGQKVPDTRSLEAIQQKRTHAVQETSKTISQLKLKIHFDRLMIEELKNSLAQESPSGMWLYSALGWWDACCDPIIGWLYTPIVKIGGVPITVMSIMRLLMIFGIALGFSFLIRRILKKINKGKMHLTDSSVFILDKVIHYIILSIGFAIALASAGLSLSNLALVLGALSVGIGFGLQTIVNNFLSSLIIMFSRTLKVGDMIEFQDGKYGQVMAINIQNTVIHTSDGVDVIIPNSEVLGNRLINWTLNDNFKRMHIPFSVAYGTDKDLVAKAACEAAQKVPCTVMNSDYLSDPQVWLTGFGDSAIDFELIVWVNVYGIGHKGSMKASYLWELDTALQKYNIAIPFPQREVRILRDTPASIPEQEKAILATKN